MEHINPNSDITVLVDSDTVWTEDTLSELLKPLLVIKNWRCYNQTENT